MHLFPRSHRACLSLVLLSGGVAAAQSQPQDCPCPSTTNAKPSVAAAAQSAKAQKAAHAKHVFTDEDMDMHKGPLPRLNMDGVDNSDEIVQSIGKYKETHKPEEVEQVLHDWYDQYDVELNAAIKQTNDFQSLRQSNVVNGYELCQEGNDYEKCERRRRAEMRGARLDNEIIKDNGLHAARIQQAFIKIRNGLMQYNLSYTWFKIRQGNGNGSF